MKKKIFISSIILIILIIVSSLIAYRIYTRSQVQHYLSFFRDNPEISTHWGLSGDVQLESVVKESPGELVMIVKWGDDDVYISIKNWLTRDHDYMVIRAFDKKKGYHLME